MATLKAPEPTKPTAYDTPQATIMPGGPMPVLKALPTPTPAPKNYATPNITPGTPPTVGHPAPLPGTAPNVDLSPSGPPLPLPGGAPVPAPAPAGPQAQTSLTPFGPGDDLRFTQVAPGQGVDRYSLAQDRFGTFADETEPAFEAALRAATQRGAAAGGLGSGMLRTSYGDLALQRTRDLGNERSRLFQGALEGTIGDSRSDRDELRTERDYQSGTNQQAIENAIRQLLTEDHLTGTDFQRQYQQATAAGALGNSNSLAQLLFGGASQSGANASAQSAAQAAAMQAFAEYLGSFGG